MAASTIERLSQWLVDWYEAMARMNHLGVLDAIRAQVPVWAVQALVAYPVDELVTAIADRSVTNVSARVAEEVCHRRKSCIVGGSLEDMAGMMTVPVADVAV